VNATLDSVKKDLNEFSDTVQTEASALASVTAQSVKHQASIIQQFVHSDSTDNKTEGKASGEQTESSVPNQTKESEESDGTGLFGVGVNLVKSLVETVQKIGGTLEDTTKDEDQFTKEIRVAGPRHTVLDQCQLLQIQNDERTFVQPPHQNIDLYREWLSEFKIGEHNGEINMLLGFNPRLREIYSQLVPAKVDNHTFWNRYFFKVHLAEVEKEKLSVATADSTQSDPKEKDETWSMCSGPTSDSTNGSSHTGELINEKDVEEEMDDREETATPRQQSAEEQTDPEEQFHSGDEWEKPEKQE